MMDDGLAFLLVAVGLTLVCLALVAVDEAFLRAGDRVPIRCRWFGHKWPRVGDIDGWPTSVPCLRRGCSERLPTPWPSPALGSEKVGGP